MNEKRFVRSKKGGSFINNNIYDAEQDSLNSFSSDKEPEVNHLLPPSRIYTVGVSTDRVIYVRSGRISETTLYGEFKSTI